MPGPTLYHELWHRRLLESLRQPRSVLGQIKSKARANRKREGFGRVGQRVGE